MITPNKEFFQWIYNRLVNVHKENPNVDYMISFKKRIEELSFDKPSWKPSKEEIDAFENLLKGEFPNKIFPGTTLANLLNKLKKLYYNEAIQVWKPSEEQMEALSEALSTFDGYEESDAIKSLYNDLKKLI